ncbi:MAG: hypothetical protein JJT90_18265 [Ectothiorhodospiraceae bacterium]|nr:hypothetical protein [Ectothiorhodospiraceae bacterium]
MFAKMPRNPPSIVVAIAALLLLTTAVCAIYLPALSAGLHFDDAASLSGLAVIRDLPSTLWFIFSGHTGPLGRPIALASFVPQASAWPEQVHQIRLINILIHGINITLVAIFASLLSARSGMTSTARQALLAGVAASMIWGLLPLLASSSLLLIQRMATLSATFMLMGFCLHLLGRDMVNRRPGRALVLMTSGLGVGLGLGVLTKESAAVFPILLLMLDRTLLNRLPKPPHYRIWRALMVVTPAMLVTGYMLWRLVTGLMVEGSFAAREFTIVERVLTQGVILFAYLKQMLLPNVAALGPFHDNYPIYGGLPRGLAFAATGFWIMAAAWAIRHGPRYPLLSFALLWYLGAHLIESSWLALELYFEHRNYVAAVGVITALVLLLTRTPERYRMYASLGLSAYGAVLAISLLQVTSLWGQPLLAADMWLRHNPDSTRAAGYASTLHLHDDNPVGARRILERAMEHNPQDPGLAMQIANIACHMQDEETAATYFQRVKRQSSTGMYSSMVPDAIQIMLHGIAEGRCSGISMPEMHNLIERLRQNPGYTHNARRRANLINLQVFIAIQQGNFYATTARLEEGLAEVSDFQALASATQILVSGGRDDLALDFINRAKKSPPRHPVLKPIWHSRMEALENAVLELDTTTSGQESGPSASTGPMQTPEL